MSQLDKGTEGYFEAFFSDIPETTPNGEFYYQFIGIKDDGAPRFILLHKDHPLIKMTDDEFVKNLDNSYYNLLAEAIYNAANG